LILFEKEINRKLFRLVLGSIIDEPVQAIINPANEQLLHGGGVAGLISRAGGEQVQKESHKKAPIDTGSATFTGAGKLPYKYIIHTVGPVYRGGENGEAELLSSAVTNALKTAAELELTSISMPSISTGIFGYPLEPAIKIITGAIYEFMKKSSSIEEIRLCEFDRTKAYEIKNYLNFPQFEK